MKEEINFLKIFMVKKRKSKKISRSGKRNPRHPDFKGVTRFPEPEFSAHEPVPLEKMSDLSWRIFRIMAEFIEGFQFLSNFKKEVSIFGSARLAPTSKWYKEAEKLGFMCAKAGYTVITGGGPGIMEAGNKGAFKAGGESVGINIQLPTEQRTNPYVGKSHAFYYFFTRKVMLAASAQAYIFFPGGFGTSDEFFEIITLIQTNKMENIPVVCVGREFWEPVLHLMNKMKEMRTIEEKDSKIFTVVDSAEEAFKSIKNSKERDIF